MALEKLAESNEVIVAIYTCGIYIFVIGCRSGRLFVVDTYTITPEFGGHGDGLLKVFSGKDLHHKEIYAYGCGNDWRLEE